MKLTLQDFTLDCPLPPQWIQYPSYTPYCMGWRMGSGESYIDLLSDWLLTLSPEDQKMYDILFPYPPHWKRVHSYKEEVEESDHTIYDEYYFSFWSKTQQLKYNDVNTATLLQQTAPIHFTSTSDQYAFLAPDFLHGFPVDADDLLSVEHYAIAEKALMFINLNDDDEGIFDHIVNSQSIEEIRLFASNIPDVKEDIWNYCLPSVYLNAYYYFFATNNAYCQQLLDTAPAVLIHDTPTADNTIGYALMEVRDVLTTLYAHAGRIDHDKVNTLLSTYWKRD